MGKASGELVDEVAFGYLPVGRGSVDDLRRDALDLFDPGPNRALDELPDGHLAHRTVPRRVEVDDHLDDLVEAAQVEVEGDALRIREDLGLGGHLDDVGVLGHRPEGGMAGRLEVDDRGLGAELRPYVVGIPVAGEPGRFDQIERVDAEAHRHGRLRRLGWGVHPFIRS